MTQPAPKKFNVLVKRTSQHQATAEAHGKKLTLAIKGGDPSLGFTAPETLLAAFGACILSNINRKAVELGLQIDDAHVEFEATKRLEPLGIEPLHYRLTLTSPEPDEKLQALYELVTSDGTATRAILEGLAPHSQLVVHKTA